MPDDPTAQPPAPPAAPVPDSPFAIAGFRYFWAGRAFAVLGGQIMGVTIAWQVYEIARIDHTVAEAVFYLGLVGLAQFLPMFLLALPAGALADRWDRKRIFAACLAADVLIALAYVALSLRGTPPLWAMFALAVVFGASRAFIAPSSQSILPMLVPRELFSRALMISSLAFQFGAIAGPAFGGMAAVVGATMTYGVSAALFAAGVACALMLGDTRPVAQPNRGATWSQIKEGLVFVWNTRIVFGAISLDLVAVLLAGATLLMPAFARDVLHQPEALGVLRAAPALGAAAMALYLSRFHIRRNGGLWMFSSVAIFGLATIVFGLSQILWLTLVALFVIGASDMISVNIRQTLIQLTTPDHMRGRVSSVSMLFIGASNELGEFESGLVARFLGPVGAAVFGGVGSMIATGAWAVLFPELRKADRLT